MTNQTTENFWQAWNSFKWPEPAALIYRLYHDDQGHPLCYSMDVLEGKYIEVDAETFALQPWNVRVIDGKLTYKKITVQVNKLEPNQSNGIPCHPQDICVIVDKQKTHTLWNKVTYEID